MSAQPRPVGTYVYLRGHVWEGELAKVLTGPSGPFGMQRCAILRNDAMHGQEVFAKPEQMDPRDTSG